MSLMVSKELGRPLIVDNEIIPECLGPGLGHCVTTLVFVYIGTATAYLLKRSVITKTFSIPPPFFPGNKSVL